MEKWAAVGFHSLWQGLKVNLHQQSHLFLELWLREGEEGGAADQKDQSRLKARIKTELLL